MLLAADVLRGSISTALAGFCWRSFAPKRGTEFPATPFRIDRLDRHSDHLVLPRWCHGDAMDRQTCPFQRNASRLFATRCTSWVTRHSLSGMECVPFSLTLLPAGHLRRGTILAATVPVPIRSARCSTSGAAGSRDESEIVTIHRKFLSPNSSGLDICDRQKTMMLTPSRGQSLR